MRRTRAEAAETREALLSAAEDLFQEKGVARTTLAEIASAAGMTRGAIYWHFNDKGALFEALHERGRLPQEHVAKLLSTSASCNPLRTLHDVAMEGLRHIAGDERSQRICTIMLLRCEYVGEMNDVLLRLRDADRELFEAVRDSFAEAQRRDLLSDRWTAEAAAAAHISAMTGLVVQWLKSDRCYDLVAVGESMLTALKESFSRHRARIERGVAAG